MNYQDTLSHIEKWNVESGLRGFCTEVCKGYCCRPCEKKCTEHEGRRLICSTFICNKVLPFEEKISINYNDIRKYFWDVMSNYLEKQEELPGYKCLYNPYFTPTDMSKVSLIEFDFDTIVSFFNSHTKEVIKEAICRLKSSSIQV